MLVLSVMPRARLTADWTMDSVEEAESELERGRVLMRAALKFWTAMSTSLLREVLAWRGRGPAGDGEGRGGGALWGWGGRAR